MFCGYISLGAAVTKLSHTWESVPLCGARMPTPLALSVLAMCLFGAAQLLVISEVGIATPAPLMVCFSFLGTSGILPYAALSQV